MTGVRKSIDHGSSTCAVEELDVGEEVLVEVASRLQRPRDRANRIREQCDEEEGGDTGPLLGEGLRASERSGETSARSGHEVGGYSSRLPPALPSPTEARPGLGYPPLPCLGGAAQSCSSAAQQPSPKVQRRRSSFSRSPSPCGGCRRSSSRSRRDATSERTQGRTSSCSSDIRSISATSSAGRRWRRSSSACFSIRSTAGSRKRASRCCTRARCSPGSSPPAASGARAALVAVVVLLLYPGYGILFHELASDAVFAAAFAGWSYLVVCTVLRPSTLRFALVGAGVGLLVLVRPGNQALVVLALVPFVLALTVARARRRLARALRLGGRRAGRVDGAQRRSLRRLHGRARRELPPALRARVPHRPHRPAGQRIGVAATGGSGRNATSYPSSRIAPTASPCRSCSRIPAPG